MDFISFFNNKEEDFINILTNEPGQYSTTLNHLADAEIIEDYEIEDLYELSEGVANLSVSDDSKHSVKVIHLNEIIKEKLVNNVSNQRLIIETILYSVLNQTKFEELKSACNFLLWPQYYNQNGEQTVSTTDMLTPNHSAIDWQSLYEH